MMLTTKLQCGCINADEKLPKNGDTVLVYKTHMWQDGWASIDISKFFEEYGFKDKGNLCKVTHWMPLPPAPFQ